MTLGTTRTCGLEPTPSDLDFDRVQEAVEEFLRTHSMPEDWKDDCYQEAWIARLEYHVIDTHLKRWLREEWDSHKHRSFERLLERAGKRLGGREAWAGKLAVIDERLREQLGIRARPGEPYEVVVARLDGHCPRHKEFQTVEFGENRDFGLCEKCGFAYDFSSDDGATP